MLRSKYTTLFVLVFLLFSTASASAASYGGVGGRPAYPESQNPRTQSIFIFALSPGQSANSGVKVFNTTPDQQVVNLYGVDSVISSGGAFACAQNSSPKTDVGAWIDLAQTSITLAPDSSQTVSFSVNVPDSSQLSVGEHDGCIAMQASSQTGTSTKGSGVVLSFRSAIRLVVTIPGKINKSLALINTSAGASKGQIVASAVLKNDGNVSLDTFLNVTLDNMFGSKVSSGPEATLPVLPSSKLTQSINFNKPFWGGFYKVKFGASYNSNPNTELGVNDHANAKYLYATTGIFFVWPSAGGLVIEIVVLLIILLVIAYYVRKAIRKRSVATSWVSYSVKSGESVESLASARGVSWRQIVAANKLSPPYALSKGQEIKLPKQSKKG
ncbi:MAG: LysM peptidoglycan-binding domain-containing protein [Candidatus Saccharimonadales bacterium]